MAGLNRADLINQLAEQYKDEMPTIDISKTEINNSMGRITLRGGMTASNTDLEKAMEYFTRAAAQMKSNFSQAGQEKAFYCEIAADAIDKLIKDQQEQ